MRIRITLVAASLAMAHFTPEQEEIIKKHPITDIIDARNDDQYVFEGTYFKLMSLLSSNTNR